MSLKSPEFARLKALGFEILSQIEPTVPEEKGTTQTAIRLDEEVLNYFQGEAYDSKLPNNYQARINGVLVRYIQIKNASDDLAKEVDRVLGVFVRLEKPIDFDAVDRQPVDLIFALLAPEDAGVDHLKALALVSRTMRNSDLCAKLRANSDPSTLHTLLTEAPTSQAA